MRTFLTVSTLGGLCRNFSFQPKLSVRFLTSVTSSQSLSIHQSSTNIFSGRGNLAQNQLLLNPFAGSFAVQKRRMATLEEFKKEEIVPHVIDSVPPALVEVKYPGHSVNLGNELTPRQVQNQPEYKWPAQADKFYLLIMTDPDAPSRADPKFREWHHFLMGNIPGSDVAKGETLSEYVGSGPPEGTGLHRYVILVFEQPGKINFADRKKFSSTAAGGREKFNTREFLKKYGISKLIAGNFFQAQWDDFVPEFYKKFTS